MSLLPSDPDRRLFLSNYLDTVVQRDVPEISRIQHVAELPKLLTALAGMSAQQLNVSELARRVGIK